MIIEQHGGRSRVRRKFVYSLSRPNTSTSSQPQTENTFCPPTHPPLWAHSEKIIICKPWRKLSWEPDCGDTPASDFKSSKLRENKFLLYTYHCTPHHSPENNITVFNPWLVESVDVISRTTEGQLFIGGKKSEYKWVHIRCLKVSCTYNIEKGN